MAQSVKRLTLDFGSGCDLMVREFEPCVGLRAGTGPYLLLLPTRPYGKDIPRLDYWLAYETIMKKVGGRPHWAKVGFAREWLTGPSAWQLL